jgi:hypothetical protein
MPHSDKPAKANGLLANLQRLAHSKSKKQLSVEEAKWDKLCEPVDALSGHSAAAACTLQPVSTRTASQKHVARPQRIVR